MDFKKLAQDNTYGVNEKAPKFLYDAMEDKGCKILFARRDRKDWQVVVTLEFYKDMLNGFDYKICPHCGEKIYGL